MDKRYFSKKLAKWYLENKRQLPWREVSDPYRIWLSEVILQQTRVDQGLPYYRRFVETFPSIRNLAAATEQKVLRLWQGLGYYTRARNLHKCAKEIVSRHNGIFPQTFRELKSLAGVGDYTAAAIASFSFGEPVAVLDGNVYRVLARIFGVHTPINTPAAKKEFTTLAGEVLDRDQPALHNQAIMEFGAIHCTPVQPKCPQCPFRDSCFALQHDLVSALPAKNKRASSRSRYFYYLVVERNSSLLMKKRDKKDIWQGLFDFVLIEKQKATDPKKIINDPEHRKYFQVARAVTVSKPYKHILTHQVIYCRFIHVEAASSFTFDKKEMQFYSAGRVSQLPKPVLISRFLEDRMAI